MRGVRGPLRAIIAQVLALYWTGEHERAAGAAENQAKEGDPDASVDAGASEGIPGPYLSLIHI